mmetsp:Transcript_27072/g.83117  ORF Transcript_27072/g.83117 Transcript_27072/m.83117 type:complete len:173 (+) Transcript_27072:582-1100(+)
MARLRLRHLPPAVRPGHAQPTGRRPLLRRRHQLPQTTTAEETVMIFTVRGLVGTGQHRTSHNNQERRYGQLRGRQEVNKKTRQHAQQVITHHTRGPAPAREEAKRATAMSGEARVRRRARVRAKREVEWLARMGLVTSKCKPESVALVSRWTSDTSKMRREGRISRSAFWCA